MKNQSIWFWLFDTNYFIDNLTTKINLVNNKSYEHSKLKGTKLQQTNFF